MSIINSDEEEEMKKYFSIMKRRLSMKIMEKLRKLW